MPFPYSYNKTLAIETVANDISMDMILRKIFEGLQKEKAKAVHLEGSTIHFKGGFQFISSWNLLLPISNGKITLLEQDKQLQAKIHLEFKEILVITSVGVPLFAIFVANKSAYMQLKEIFITIVLGWFWLFGMNYITTIFRFPLFVKKTIKTEI